VIIGSEGAKGKAHRAKKTLKSNSNKVAVFGGFDTSERSWEKKFKS